MPLFIRHTLLGGLLLTAAAAAFEPVAAQQKLATADVEQIVGRVLDFLVPESKVLSRVPVAQRGVFFDHSRTSVSFAPVHTTPYAAIAVRAGVAKGDTGILADCKQVGRSTCLQLGWGVYTSIEPASLDSSNLVVRATVLWPDRGSAPFAAGVAPRSAAILVGYLAELHLRRESDGTWKVLRQGKTIVF
jgi:hypothetical protein